jgi:hypothetical protein
MKNLFWNLFGFNGKVTMALFRQRHPGMTFRLWKGSR